MFQNFFDMVDWGKALQRDMREGMSPGMAQRILVNLNNFPEKDQKKENERRDEHEIMN